MLIPANKILSPSDRQRLQQMSLERFAQCCIDHPKCHKLDIQDNVLLIEVIAPVFINRVIRGFNQLLDAAYLVLGCNSISLFFANEHIADYTRGNTFHLGLDDMVATLEREQVEVKASEENQTPTPTNDYISLPQLREMSERLGGENDEFMAWMETNDINVPSRFYNGVPYFQKKAIAKATEQWNLSKIQGIMAEFLGTPNTVKNTTIPEAAVNGIAPAQSEDSEEMKLLRTPPGFSIVKTGKDKYQKTVKKLADALGDRWPKYQQHLVEVSLIGDKFLGRLARQFGDKDAYAKLHEAVQDFANNPEAAAV